jgi:hypothetical protein
MAWQGNAQLAAPRRRPPAAAIPILTAQPSAHEYPHLHDMRVIFMRFLAGCVACVYRDGGLHGCDCCAPDPVAEFIRSRSPGQQ